MKEDLHPNPSPKGGGNKSTITADRRAEQLRAWLSHYYQIEPHSLTRICGDASFRRYFRFAATPAPNAACQSLIAVDAPPEHENSQAFINIAIHLSNNKLPVPKIHQYALDAGFYVQQDFGDQLLLASLHDRSADDLYKSAIQHLAKMFSVTTDSLPLYDSQLLQQEMCLFSDWFVRKHKNRPMDDALKNMLNQTYRLLADNALNQPQGFVHRDYHSRNIMVLNGGQLGIIDFQDAVKGPLTYDLVSLLRDCYIDWPQHKIDDWICHYIKLLPCQYSVSEFMRWFDLMGIQRHLKAAGIFARLHYRDNKPAYLNNIPRILHYLMQVSAKYAALKDFNHFVKSLQ